jgi:hypothetical protein
MKTLLTFIAVLAIPLSAQATKAQHKTRASQPQPRIACTDVGCLPVPAECGIAGGKTLDGTPTGFDVMTCPGGTRYGHL